MLRQASMEKPPDFKSPEGKQAVSKSQASILNRQYTEKTSSDLRLWFDLSAKKNKAGRY